MAEVFSLLKAFGIQSELDLIYILSTLILVQAGGVLIALQFLTSPYGRYARSTWGFGVNARLAWFVQECPAFIVPCVVLWYARNEVLGWTPNIVLLVLFMIHYFQRLVYVFLDRSSHAVFVTAFDIRYRRL